MTPAVLGHSPTTVAARQASPETVPGATPPHARARHPGAHACGSASQGPRTAGPRAGTLDDADPARPSSVGGRPLDVSTRASLGLRLDPGPDTA